MGTLATLPKEQQADDVILLAPAVSAAYDLAASLSRVRGTMYAFYSERDTTAWGKSAGLTGFTGAEKLPADVRPRFKQIAHQAEYEQAGNTGDHFGWRNRKFARQYLAPLLRDPATPDEE